MATNERVIRFTAWAQVAILAILVAGGILFSVQRVKPTGPVLSGVKVKAFVHSGDGLPPKEATVEVYVDDTEAEWSQRLQDAVKGLEKVP